MAAIARLTEPEIVATLRAAGCVFAEDEAALLLAEDYSSPQLAAAVARRSSGEPLEVILGWAEFAGLRVGIDAGVFVPRQRTAFLVETAVGLASSRAVVVDLCCGSGALGLAVRSAVPGIRLFAADLEPAAVACARRNVGDRGDVFLGDLFEPLPPSLHGTVDLLLVNAPYVPSREIERMPPEARDFEPRRALDGGIDGLAVHRRVAAEAPSWLARRGTLLIEVSENQAEDAAAMVERSGLLARILYSDDYDATVVTGTMP
jgi:release factor glutamine methyltransferase